jgi:hypothetical protein
MPRTKLINLGLIKTSNPSSIAALSTLEAPVSSKRKRSVSLTSLPNLNTRPDNWGQLMVYRPKRPKDAGFDANPEPIIQGSRLQMLGSGLGKPSASLMLRARSASLSSGAAGDDGSNATSRIEPMIESASTQSMTLAIGKLRIQEAAKDSGCDEIAAKEAGGGEGASGIETETGDEHVAGAADGVSNVDEKGLSSFSERLWAMCFPDGGS